VALAREHGMRIMAIKMPLPSQFYKRLPEEANFDTELMRLLAEQDVTFYDFSEMMDEPRYYFDTDHLNRKGLRQFFQSSLRELLVRPHTQ
jgi:hypothetical protein